MKKIMKSKIFIVIICGIIFTSLGVYGATVYPYQASEVIYNPSSGNSITVNEALNEIYNITKLGDATAEDIVEGKTAIVQGKLITGTLKSNIGCISKLIDFSSNYKSSSNSGTINVEGYKYLLINSLKIGNTNASKSSSGSYKFGKISGVFKRDSYSIDSPNTMPNWFEISGLDAIEWSYKSNDEEIMTVSYTLIK